VSGRCPDCNCKTNKFVSSKQQGNGLVNDFINSLPVELHLVDRGDDGKIKRVSFAGPGTKLNQRLNPDGSYKAYSKPINKLDRGAYTHDLCYMKNKDTKTRNSVCDPPLQKVARDILDDPNTGRVNQANAKIVEVAMATKRRFGMGYE